MIESLLVISLLLIARTCDVGIDPGTWVQFTAAGLLQEWGHEKSESSEGSCVSWGQVARYFPELRLASSRASSALQHFPEGSSCSYNRSVLIGCIFQNSSMTLSGDSTFPFPDRHMGVCVDITSIDTIMYVLCIMLLWRFLLIQK